MTKPRGSVIARRFLAGESIESIATWCRARGMGQDDAWDHIEGCIRRALNRKRARR